MNFLEFFNQQAKTVHQLASEWGEHPTTRELLASVIGADLRNERVATSATGALVTAYRAARHDDTKNGIKALLGMALNHAANDPHDLDM